MTFDEGEVLRLDLSARGKAEPEVLARGVGDGIMSAALDPPGRVLAVGCEDGSIRLVDATTAAELARLDGHAQAVSSLAWLPDGSRLVSGGEDRAVRLWNPKTGDALCHLRGHLGQVRGLAVSADGRSIVSAGQDQTIRIWTIGE